MTDLLDDLVEARVPWTSPTIASWYSPADLRRQLRTAMAVEAERVENPTFGQEFRDAVGADGPRDPLAWANRRHDLPGGGWVVTGIRFRGAEALRPFVDVVASTEPPTTDGLASLAAAVVPAYDDFAPLCLRADVPLAAHLVEELDVDSRFDTPSVDMHVVSGLVPTLRAHPRAAAYPRVGLRAGDPHRLAVRVAEIYTELGRGEPELAAWANPEDADSLAACADEGLLFEVLVDDRPAGVVAALRYDGHAMTGFSVQELCLDAAHRGQHVAPAAVQRLLDELPAGPGDTLWGTIHPGNLPSLRNALSIGRVLTGGYLWVTPVGLPGMAS